MNDLHDLVSLSYTWATCTPFTQLEDSDNINLHMHMVLYMFHHPLHAPVQRQCSLA